MVNVSTPTFTGGSAGYDDGPDGSVNVVNVAQPRVRADAHACAGSYACVKPDCPDVHDVHEGAERVGNHSKTNTNPVVNVAVNVVAPEPDPELAADHEDLDGLLPGGDA